MKKNSISLFAMTLLMVFCFTPRVMAKEKKVTYLGHEYSGKMNMQNNPEGEGSIVIADVAVSGTFNANNITNVKIEEGWIKIAGEVSFDESDRITVKAGSKISNTIYLPSIISTIRTEEDLNNNSLASRVFHKILEKDSIVDLTSTHADFYISTKVAELVPNPPTLISQVHAELVPIEIYYKVKDNKGRITNKFTKRQTKVYKIETIINEDTEYHVDHYADIYRKIYTEYRLDNYKDEFGRIWNVNASGGKCVGKVTYPDGGYIETDEHGKIKDFKIKNDNNFEVKDEYVIFSDGIQIKFDPSSDSFKQFKSFISKPKIDKACLYKIIIPKSQISKLSNKEIVTLINDKISQAFVHYRYRELLSNGKKWKGLYVCDGDEKSEIGKYHSDDGVYISNKEQAAKDNAVAKKQAAKEQAAYNQLCKQYGKKYADAAWNGRIIVGMPEELMKKLYYCVLRYQSASRKKYDSADARAIIWVTNGRVSSISYY